MKLCSIALFLFIAIGVLHAQQITVRGTVIDNVLSEPIIGATILEKNNPTNGTVTDFDGNFSISVASNATLVFSYVGYITQEIAVNGRTSIDIFSNIKKINNDARANIQIVRDLDLLISKYYYLQEFPLPLTNYKLFNAIWERFVLKKDIITLILHYLKVIKYSFKR